MDDGYRGELAESLQMYWSGRRKIEGWMRKVERERGRKSSDGGR